MSVLTPMIWLGISVGVSMLLVFGGSALVENLNKESDEDELIRQRASASGGKKSRKRLAKRLIVRPHSIRN